MSKLGSRSKQARIRVAHLIGGLELGGAESLLYNVSQHQCDVEHTIISLSSNQKNASRFLTSGRSLYLLELRDPNSVSPFIKVLRQVREIYRLIRLLVRLDVDVIQTWMYQSDLIGGVVGTLLRTKIVWGIYSSNLERGYYKKSTYWAIRLCGRLSHYLPHRIVACTRTGALAHIDIGYPKDRIIHIPIAVDTNSFKKCATKRSAIRQSCGVGENTKVVGMVARWDPQKDHKTMVEGFSLVCDERLDVELWLAGGYGMDESNRELLELIESSGVTSRIRLFGAIEDIVSFYSGIDIFALLSNGEGMPNVMLEAVSCELPCVASSVGDIPNVVGEYCQLLKHNNDLKLRQALIKLIELDKGETVKLTRLVRQHLIDNYSIESVSKRYTDLYRDLSKSQ